MSIPINENTIGDIIRSKLERVLLETLADNERLKEENDKYFFCLLKLSESFDEIKKECKVDYP